MLSSHLEADGLARDTPLGKVLAVTSHNVVAFFADPGQGTAPAHRPSGLIHAHRISKVARAHQGARMRAPRGVLGRCAGAVKDQGNEAHEHKPGHDCAALAGFCCAGHDLELGRVRVRDVWAPRERACGECEAGVTVRPMSPQKSAPACYCCGQGDEMGMRTVKLSTLLPRPQAPGAGNGAASGCCSPR